MPISRKTLGPWPLGINNSADAHALPVGAARDALNVDFTEDGRVVSRPGFGQTQEVDNGHSLRTVGGKSFIGIGPSLGVITAMDSLAVTTLRAGLDIAPVSYAERGGEVWWSNGAQSGRCGSDNSDHPWAPPTPDSPLAVYAGAGTLRKGRYRLFLTHAMADGEEGGASDISTFDLASAGSIIVTLPAAAAGADRFCLYCTAADGEIFQHCATVAAATASITISAKPSGRKSEGREFLRPLPAGTAICFHGTRLLSIYGEFLYYSDPHNYGLYNPDEDWIALGAVGSILASAEAGVFVAADRTWWFAGDDIRGAVQCEKLAFGAVSGTEFEHPVSASPVVGWYSQQGIVLGSSDGSVALPQRSAGFVAPTASTGAVWVRQRNGRTHIVVSMDATAAYDRQVSDDFTEARLRYDDDSTTVCMALGGKFPTSRYSNWYFTGYANVFGAEYGIDSIGLRLLEGDDDDGTDIPAVLDCGLIGYGSSNIKAPECVYVLGKSSSPLVVDVALPTGDTYSYPARSSSESLKTQRHDGMKGLMNLRQTAFSTVIRNDEGGTMELSAVEVLVNESKRRI
jgi:hypothetical protein